ncbi:hypothetical protein J3Q64DRAFT_1821899 [Phycomyces blakesleeanus]|uniref:Uncharacterized protein n=2 Tax=Phycomyces blakesleeanus TaxID=4837 RepID=A0A163AFQ0_PHYB8|nr:hypothetical protein PHYBLDRAFT_65779 [Phycomyces blakesleeanus NRRL 1555(-)]OAD73181.1 hypothetical protein PHYBLDRAFT_65779 [Phycomyces blakesleeanus NRRL 1555(-)]|eukprot:XP_018291221.1 hypothetical protein PHYBLDRAFT_65779 [Phycomyces blakesleeanus NRRL 1555(-)]
MLEEYCPIMDYCHPLFNLILDRFFVLRGAKKITAPARAYESPQTSQEKSDSHISILLKQGTRPDNSIRKFIRAISMDNYQSIATACSKNALVKEEQGRLGILSKLENSSKIKVPYIVYVSDSQSTFSVADIQVISRPVKDLLPKYLQNKTSSSLITREVLTENNSHLFVVVSVVVISSGLISRKQLVPRFPVLRLNNPQC